jgi:dTDP-glucose 4,6-dehydratase
MATACLMEYVKKYCPSAKVVVIGTDEVYGHLGLDDPPFTEYTILDPRSPYSSSKASSDLIALSYYSTFGLNVIVTRCCNNYGPHQHSEKFIPTVIRSLIGGKKVPVYGTGQNIREWIYVDDHNKSILDIMANFVPGKVYNIGSGVEKTNIEIVEALKNSIDIAPENRKLEDVIKYVEDRKGHDFRYAIASLNYKRTFNLINFEQGLFKTLTSYYIEELKK